MELKNLIYSSIVIQYYAIKVKPFLLIMCQRKCKDNFLACKESFTWVAHFQWRIAHFSRKMATTLGSNLAWTMSWTNYMFFAFTIIVLMKILIIFNYKMGRCNIIKADFETYLDDSKNKSYKNNLIFTIFQPKNLTIFLYEISHCCKNLKNICHKSNDVLKKIIKIQKNSKISFKITTLLSMVQVGSKKYIRLFNFFPFIFF
jgi:hypothetical protein